MSKPKQKDKLWNPPQSSALQIPFKRSTTKKIRNNEKKQRHIEKTLKREYIGQHEFSLSGSYQLGYSTAYNTQSHIKVVCKEISSHIFQIVIRREAPKRFRLEADLHLV